MVGRNLVVTFVFIYKSSSDMYPKLYLSKGCFLCIEITICFIIIQKSSSRFVNDSVTAVNLFST
jgi:hypothetical protein